MSVPCTGIPPPETLRDALDFSAWLNDARRNSIKESVGRQLNEKALTYFNGNTVSHDLGGGVKKCFNDMIEHTTELRKLIVYETILNNYGKYHTLEHTNNTDEGCTTFVTIILGLIAPLYNTLYYLYFQVADDFRYQGGATWENMRCDGLQDGHDLKNWLTTAAGVPSSHDSNARLLSGGYSAKAQLSSNRGSHMKDSLDKLVDNGSSLGALPKLLLGLCLNIPNSHSSSAAALVFIAAFCKGVEDGTFDVKVGEHVDLRDLCSSISEKLKKITGAGNERDSYLCALYNSSVVLCNGFLKLDSFDTYVTWLQTHLSEVVDFITQLANDCSKWQYISVRMGNSAGPFPYGFVTTVKWEENQWNRVAPRLATEIKMLINSDGGKGLRDLLNAFKQVPVPLSDKSVNSTTTTAIGTLASAGIVGGTGAALYATNAFGVTTFVKSFL
ncbi:secreted antigen 1 [Babesia caballi]|uniref:Secreted antigen 1 n=1 Tax=Babesia caballi TaxID=5871 RepID=A0AAV4M325_BABCB|nr:secreted antigen 1 [Babesia caballi]